MRSSVGWEGAPAAVDRRLHPCEISHRVGACGGGTGKLGAAGFCKLPGYSDALIELPPEGILKTHGTILPEYRRGLPTFWILANGEQQAIEPENFMGGSVLGHH
jgi:hypothetical protein